MAATIERNIYEAIRGMCVSDASAERAAALAAEFAVEKFNNLQQRHAKIAAELEQCAVDMNSDKLIPIVTCLNQWARLLRQ